MLFSDRDVLALTIYGESRGEPIEGQIAVGCVVRNRVRAEWRGAVGYASVCLAPKQFSCWNEGDTNRPMLEKLAERLRLAYGGAQVDAPTVRVALPAALFTALWVADGILTGATPDRVGEARHYHARWAMPTWAAGQRPQYVVGSHLFYVGIS